VQVAARGDWQDFADAVLTSVLNAERIQRFRILLVATHGPRPDECGLGLAVLDHLDGPALVVGVLDDPRRPAVVCTTGGVR
jgi:hypothetical protein